MKRPMCTELGLLASSFQLLDFVVCFILFLWALLVSCFFVMVRLDIRNKGGYFPPPPHPDGDIVLTTNCRFVFLVQSVIANSKIFSAPALTRQGAEGLRRASPAEQ